MATKAVHEDNINNRVDSYSNFQSLGSIIAFNGAIDFGMREIGGYVDQFNNFQWQQVVSQNIQYCLVHAVHKEIDRVLNLSSVSTEDCVKKKEQIDVVKQGFDLLIETLEQDKQRQLDELEKLQIQYDSQAKITQRDQLRELRDQMLMMSRSLDMLKAKQETYFSILDGKSHSHVFNEEKRSLSDLKQSITYKFQNQKSQLIKQLVLEAKKIDDLEDKEGVGFEASSRLKKN